MRLVISGVHVTVLAGVLLFLLRLCAVPELAALSATAGAAWTYALVSGLSAPVVRAAAGFTPVPDRAISVPPHAHPEPAGRGGAGLRFVGSGRIVRRQLPAFVPLGSCDWTRSLSHCWNRALRRWLAESAA